MANYITQQQFFRLCRRVEARKNYYESKSWIKADLCKEFAGDCDMPNLAYTAADRVVEALDGIVNFRFRRTQPGNQDGASGMTNDQLTSAVIEVLDILDDIVAGGPLGPIKDKVGRIQATFINDA